MKQLLYIFLMINFTVPALSQDTGITAHLLTNKKTAQAIHLGFDSFGYQYSIINNELIKHDDKASVKYKNLSLGTIYSADLQNPLQIVLFYKNFNTAVLLDNQLNETARIDFSALHLLAEAVALAGQNRLWVFDINSQQIGLYDLTKNNFKTITTPLKEIIKNYKADYNYFYWVDKSNNFFAANIFGKIFSLGNLPEFEQVQILSDKEVLLKTDNKLLYYNLEKNQTIPINIVEKSFKNFYYKEQILAIFTQHEIIKYKVILK